MVSKSIRPISSIWRSWCQRQIPVCTIVETTEACSQHYESNQQVRGIKLGKIFSKEKREERKKRLQEELKKGHFDDFKQLRDTKGKVFQSSPILLPKKAAQRFPSIVPYGLSGEPTDFPEHNGQITLVCAAFRQGAQPMIDAWSKAFDEKFRDQDKAAVVEISLVDSFVMSLWPFRSTLMAQAAKSDQKYSINSNFLFLFKDVDFFQRKLELPNRLVGYVFLLDTENLIRWKGCGFPEKSELDSLLSCAETLIQQQDHATSR